MNKKYWWEKLSDEEILDLKICDLKLSLKRSSVQKNINKLYSEIESKSLRFRPYIWISDDWFTPDGINGFAVPFFLIHPRLKRIEQKMMMEIEGGTPQWCMKLLRHEAGHAIDNAYGLRRKRRRQNVFGKTSTPYPDSYIPKPFSKSHVQHLDAWYAQAHPDEDWAETFAVWLTPKSAWKKKYQRWPALKKLLTVDELMQEIKNKKPINNLKESLSPAKNIQIKLKTYYRKKRERYGFNQPSFFSGDIEKIFSPSVSYQPKTKAVFFIRSHRKDICRQVARWTGLYQYTVNQILEEIIEYCHTRKLYITKSPAKTRLDFISMLTAQSMNYLLSGQHRIAM